MPYKKVHLKNNPYKKDIIKKFILLKVLEKKLYKMIIKNSVIKILLIRFQLSQLLPHCGWQRGLGAGDSRAVLGRRASDNGLAKYFQLYEHHHGGGEVEQRAKGESQGGGLVGWQPAVQLVPGHRNSRRW